MIKVGLVTSWNDRCGISQYAHHLVEHANKDGVKIDPVLVPFEDCASVAHAYDIMHMNESGWTMQGFRGQAILDIRRMGKKSLLTVHASNPTNNKSVLTNQFDHVVVHERGTEDGFHFIPQGAVINPWYGEDRGTQYTFGTNGFPLGFKNLPRLAEAIMRLNSTYSLLSLMPESGHADARAIGRQLRNINSNVTCEYGWLTDTEMVYNLAQCRCLVYPYTNHTPGPSGAAMIGISTGRPVVVSRCTQFAHIKDRDDEFTFIESEDPSVEDIMDGLQRAMDADDDKIPRKTYDEHRWDRVGDAYVKLVKEIMA